MMTWWFLVALTTTSGYPPGDLFERLAYGDPLGESEKKRYVSDILEGVGEPQFPAQTPLFMMVDTGRSD